MAARKNTAPAAEPVVADTPADPVAKFTANVMPAVYTPTTTDPKAIIESFRSAMGETQALAKQVETRGLTRLIVPIADYYATMFAANGTYPDEKQTRKFFSDIIADESLHTSQNTMKALVTLAVKAGALMAQVQRTSVFIGWYRNINSKVEFNTQAEKPTGKDWSLEILCNVKVTRPYVNSGKKGEVIWDERPAGIRTMTHQDINDAYNTLIIRKPATPDGKVSPAHKGADDKGNHGAGANNKVVTVAGADDLDVFLAALTIMKDTKRRNALGITEAGNNVMVELLSMLDTHINHDGDYIPVPSSDTTSRAKAAA